MLTNTVKSFTAVLVTLLLFIGVDINNGSTFGISVQAHDFGGGPPPGPPLPRPPLPPPPPCSPPPGACCPTSGGGGKVLYYTGAETFTRTDIEINGVFPINLTRKYDSQSQYDSPLGYGWSHNHDFRIYEYSDNSVVLRSGCGIKTKYTFTAGSYQRKAGSLLANITASNGEFTVNYLNGQVQFFDAQGRLQWWEDTSGNRLEYTYNPTGKLPLTGASPYSLDPSQPMTVAFNYQLTKVEERLANGSLSGNFIDFSYHSTTGRLTSATSNDGRTITYTHDVANATLTLGNLVGVTGLEGLISTYQYDDRDASNEIQDYHNITSIQEGNTAPYVEKYDERDRVIQETYGARVLDFDYVVDLLETKTTEIIKNNLGVPIHTVIKTYEFGTNGFITKEIDGEGNETQFERNSIGLVLREESYQGNGAGAVSVKRIDRTFYANGRINTETTRLDNGTTVTTDDETVTTTLTYDDTLVATEETVSSQDLTKIFKTETTYNHNGNNKPTTIQAERKYLDATTFLETSYTYNSNGDILTTTLPDGRTMENEYGVAYAGKYVTRTFFYDDQNAPLAGLEETYQYDNKGNRTHVTDALSHATITTYDDNNRRKTVTNAKGHVTTYVYDTNDNLAQIKRDRSVTGDQLDITKITYDSKNRVDQIDRTDIGGLFVKQTSIRYDTVGNVIARGDAYGNETLLAYDKENRLIRITDAQGNYIQYTINAQGQQTKSEYYNSSDSLVRSSTAVFDDLDRQVKIIGAINQTTTFTYDAVGNRDSAIDALSRPTTQYTYDTLSRLGNINNADNKNTIYQYDDRDQLRFVTDQVGLTTEYQYNELGQLTKLISPDTGTTEYTYDLVGNRKTQKDARTITVTFAYDELNRITSKTYPDTSLNVTYTYDTCTNGIGKLCTMQDKEGITTNGYDVRGNLITRSRLTNGDTYITQFGYDLNDRMTSTMYPSGRLVTYVRNTLGQVSSVTTTPNSGSAQTVASNLTYLPFGTLEDMDWGNGLSLNQSFDSDYRLTNQVLGTVYSRTYSYDDVNNIKNIVDNITAGKSQSFNYDDLDRLDDATGNYGNLDYGYDDVGNRINLAVDSGTPTVYNYSTSANQLNNSTGAQTHSFTYDANGNTKTKDAFTFSYDNNNRLSQASDGSATTTYGFNGKGERTKKVTSTATTLYHYDSSGNLLFETDTSGNTQVEYIWLGNQRLAKVGGGNLYFTHTDHLGTVQLLTDTNANVVWSADYEPFGEVTINPASTITNNLRMPGQYADVETGLSYNYFRDYDPSIGRYIESDPLGVYGSLNTYSYTSNMPTRYIDPYGDAPVSLGWAIFRELVLSYGCEYASEYAKEERIKDLQSINENINQLRNINENNYNDALDACRNKFKRCAKKPCSKSSACQKTFKGCERSAVKKRRDENNRLREQQKRREQLVNETSIGNFTCTASFPPK